MLVELMFAGLKCSSCLTITQLDI